MTFGRQKSKVMSLSLSSIIIIIIIIIKVFIQGFKQTLKLTKSINKNIAILLTYLESKRHLFTKHFLNLSVFTRGIW